MSEIESIGSRPKVPYDLAEELAINLHSAFVTSYTPDLRERHVEPGTATNEASLAPLREILAPFIGYEINVKAYQVVFNKDTGPEEKWSSGFPYILKGTIEDADSWVVKQTTADGEQVDKVMSGLVIHCLGQLLVDPPEAKQLMVPFYWLQPYPGRRGQRCFNMLY
jgi:hypothetical protein